MECSVEAAELTSPSCLGLLIPKVGGWNSEDSEGPPGRVVLMLHLMFSLQDSEQRAAGPLREA